MSLVGRGGGRYRHPDHLTVVELAAFLSLKPSTIRVLVHRHGIEAVGKEGRAMLYNARAFVDTVGSHDRLYVRKRR